MAAGVAEMNAYEEVAALIGCQAPMVGIVTRPARGSAKRSAVAVVLLGAGPVHHVGPNRLTVRLARRLAECGLVSVRFDHRGVGDSAPRADGQPFNVGAVDEAREVMNYLAENDGLHAFVFLGICSGADTALKVALEDPRVVGAVMINGGGQGVGTEWDAYEYSRTQTRHYLKNAVRSLDSWRRAFTGRIQYGRLLAALIHRMRNRGGPPEEAVRAAGKTARDIEGLVARGVRLLWVHSEDDLSRGYFETMFGKDARHLVASGGVLLEVIPFVDHTFTARHGQERLMKAVESWLAAFEHVEDALGGVPRVVAR